MIETEASSLRNMIGMVDGMKMDVHNFDILYNEELVEKIEEMYIIMQKYILNFL